MNLASARMTEKEIFMKRIYSTSFVLALFAGLLPMAATAQSAQDQNTAPQQNQQQLKHDEAQNKGAAKKARAEAKASNKIAKTNEKAAKADADAVKKQDKLAKAQDKAAEANQQAGPH
jgi:hypothetical protein